MPDVAASIAPDEVRSWVAIDQHKFSIVAAVLPVEGGKPEVCRIETTEKAICRLIDRQGGPEGLSVCYQAGPGGFALWRPLTAMEVACDVVAPSLIPVRNPASATTEPVNLRGLRDQRLEPFPHRVREPEDHRHRDRPDGSLAIHREPRQPLLLSYISRTHPRSAAGQDRPAQHR